MPAGARGRPAWYVQIWWIFDALFVRPTPQVFYAWRRFALRLFGARIGKDVLIRPGVRVAYPWKLVVGDNCWIGDGVRLYNIDEITLGDHTVVSQDAYLCSGTHDARDITFPVVASPIRIESECWIAAGVRRTRGPDWARRSRRRVFRCAVGRPARYGRRRLPGSSNPKTEGAQNH
jgi:putative colanic acid biosynthesis acetyltransferase WcaF